MEVVSELFKEAPESWGFRGDPYLWRDLERRFKSVTLPYAEQSFTEDVKRLFRQITGEELRKESKPYVESYAHGGMSSGMVSGAFWLQQGLPLLLERLEKANKTLSP